MGVCGVCGAKSKTISNFIGTCSSCLRAHGLKALEVARSTHRSYRRELGLPEEIPRGAGVRCGLCVNECEIPPGSAGYCGFWRNLDGRLTPITGRPDIGLVMWYYDPHPTNCVAGPVCPANTSRGYPKYTAFRGIEVGYYNLAVFYFACNLNCLFCQNWEHKTVLVNEYARRRYLKSVDELVEAALNPRVTCVCYFGGDPGPQVTHALATSRKLLSEAGPGSMKRICWETNGLVNPKVMESMAEVSLVSGGIVKVDWKAWTPEIYEALTGIDGRRAVERVKANVKLVADLIEKREEPPLLTVSTLLVPGYVDAYEVGQIANYIASLNPRIPYVLLAFHPDNILRDLPKTSRKHAEEAYNEARRAGLKEVYIGNAWLLGDYY